MPAEMRAVLAKEYQFPDADLDRVERGEAVARAIRDGGGEAVLERLEHRLHVRERRAQVVARPCDELTAGVEQPLQVRGHLVQRRGELGDLGRPVLVGTR